MRKLLLGVAMLLFGLSSFGQAVTDQAVIPVSVTLNAILRLTVTSGGNIVFVVNTVAQYNGGIENSTLHDTDFLVSSSRNFTVTMTSENTTHFVGLESGSVDEFDIRNIGYAVTGTGVTVTALQILSDERIIVDAGLAGGNQAYKVSWELATPAVVALNTAAVLDKLLAQSLPADVYVNNIFLTLAPRN